ncbi:5,10-methylenetetrahydrofolate reductase [Thermocrinis albus DSM 14484]|uniref:Methylenetetrahydrofolate reductase n=1 Tax=Thermocrinis albus (strain DSM 14484 / JCM 11386 / HI 11/12) TaxID=638303 RepID=D3SPS2_THEAH|nr:methylenetetrahydrofolate reductase [NAD(P)H] [Thermocrinis albus]ADC89159.1 5,10-methylenetetrahydrofolate reductase [Thermocrinis albus DSM 14484]
MKIRDLLRKGFSISFEFFPPKTEEGEEELFETIRNLQSINPTFVSVTYGAGGSTREKTRRVVERIHRETSLTVMAHLTCIAHTEEELTEILRGYREIGIENILALRGDRPKDNSATEKRGCQYAYQLVRLIRTKFGDHFSVGVASYPEGHPESPNLEWEVRYFKMKVEEGADFSITQMFFDNSYYYRFVELCRKEGIDIPIIPGIMPITNFRQIQRFASMCGASIPHHVVQRLEPYAHLPQETMKVGVELAIKQCEDLIENGVPGLHFYTLNKSKATLLIYDAIKDRVPTKI